MPLVARDQHEIECQRDGGNSKVGFSQRRPALLQIGAHIGIFGGRRLMEWQDRDGVRNRPNSFDEISTLPSQGAEQELCERDGGGELVVCGHGREVSRHRQVRSRTEHRRDGVGVKQVWHGSIEGRWRPFGGETACCNDLAHIGVHRLPIGEGSYQRQEPARPSR